MARITEFEEKLKAWRDDERLYTSNLRFAHSLVIPDSLASGKESEDSYIAKMMSTQCGVDNAIFGALGHYIVALKRARESSELDNDVKLKITEIVRCYKEEFIPMYQDRGGFISDLYHSIVSFSASSFDSEYPGLPIMKFTANYKFNLPHFTIDTLASQLNPLCEGIEWEIKKVTVPLFDMLRGIQQEVHNAILPYYKNELFEELIKSSGSLKEYTAFLLTTVRAISTARFIIDLIDFRKGVAWMEKKIATMKAHENHEKSNIDDLIDLDLSKLERWFHPTDRILYNNLKLPLYLDDEIVAYATGLTIRPVLDPHDLLTYFEQQNIPLEEINQNDIDTLTYNDYFNFLKEYYGTPEKLQKEAQRQYDEEELPTRFITYIEDFPEDDLPELEDLPDIDI